MRLSVSVFVLFRVGMFFLPLKPLEPSLVSNAAPQDLSIRVYCVYVMQCSGVKIPSLSKQICLTSAVKGQ